MGARKRDAVEEEVSAAEAPAPPIEPGALESNALALSAEEASAAGGFPSLDDPTLTPMLRQYLEVKFKHPDTLLFFRLGDFYELFFEDAVKAAGLLQITLTSRAKGDSRVPMCGVPYHAAGRYIAKLVENGLRVAICDQVEEAGGPGIVRREVTRVVTPGVVLDEQVLSEKAHNFLCAVALTGPEGRGEVGVALLEASTGEFLAFEAPSVAHAAQELLRFEVRELLVAEECRELPGLAQLKALLPQACAVASLGGSAFSPARAHAFLKAHFGVAALDGFGLSPNSLAVAAAGGALRYLKETQKNDGRHVDRVGTLSDTGRLILDEASLRNLEVVKTLRDGARKGSLLGVLDRTATGMGARKLTRWLSSPLRSVAEIECRLDAVEELAGRGVLREELLSKLREVLDVERLCGRLCLGVGNARDLKALGHSLEAMPKLADALEKCGASLLKGLSPALRAPGPLGAALTAAVAEEPPVSLKEGGLFKPDFHPKLKELVGLSTSGKEHLTKIELRERERTGISSLKVRFNKVFGYYLEVTKSNLANVPKDYERKQTTVGAERYSTPELKEYEQKVLSAEDERCALELSLFDELKGRVVSEAPRIRAAAEAVGAIDALLSFARCAAEYGYVRPTVDESEELHIQGGRHPVVERMLDGERFVPNDIKLDRKDAQLLVITGPNMAGKSTVMRQVALCVVMAQAGSFVPAKSAKVGLCDRVFTRVGAADNLARGQSTFMVEMTETAAILHHATEKSLVVLDEIGRGTSTFDGLSIAWAVAEHLHDVVGARALFATHYHELVDLSRERARVKNAQVAVKEQNGKITFLRKLVPGGASRSYGIEVARLAGLPKEVLARSKEILFNLEAGELDEAGHPRTVRRVAASSPDQLGLFGMPSLAEGRAPYRDAGEDEALEKLKRANLDATTPLQALNLLAELKAALGKG